MKLPFVIDRDFLQGLCAESPDRQPEVPRGDVSAALLTREALETVLVKQTLDQAYRNILYYRRLMDEAGFHPDSYNDLTDLRRLPFLTKSAFRQNRGDIIDPDSKIVSIRATSGTTGHAVPIMAGAEETECLSLWRRIASRGDLYEDSPDILLSLVPAIRGPLNVGASSSFVISAIYNTEAPSLRLPVSYEDSIIQQLFERFPIAGKHGRVTMLRCMPPFLFSMLTKAMLDRAIEPESTAVRTVFLSGGYVTEKIRRLAQELWKARLYPNFSCTEVRGYATECTLYPNRYHYGPTVFAEVVDIENHLPVDEDEDGLLVLTSLYPFQQAQPFIRYILGDVVTYVGKSCECGAIGRSMEFRGRREHCLDLTPVLQDGARRKFLGTTEIADVLSCTPEVPSDFFPRFMTQIEEGVINVDVEVTWKLSASWEERVSGQIEESLAERLSARYDGQEFKIRVRLHNKGELRNYFRLYRED